MANPTYASTGLPYSPMVDSWSITEPYKAPLETDTDGANSRLRTRPGDDTARISFSIMYTKAQWNTLRAFVLTTLNRGTVRFDMQVWNGSGFVLRTVQFGKPINPTTQEPQVVVAFDLKVYGGL